MKNNHYIIFHYRFDRLAGTERALHNLIEYIASKEPNKITLLLASEPTDLAFDFAKYSVEVVYLFKNEKKSSSLLTFHFRILIQLISFFKTCNQKINCFCLATNPFLAVLIWFAGRLNLKSLKAVIACEHFSLSVSGKISLLMRKIFYRYLYVVTLTEKDRLIIDKRYKPISCVCIPNAIPFELSPYIYEEKDKKIISIGRLTFQKGFDLLIQSYAMIANKYPDWKLTIIGDDYGEKSKLLDLIRHFKLHDKVMLHEATRDITPYYKEAQFYVLSSRFEGLPMVMLEAMSFGLPIVSFDCPTGPAELVNDENGILIENGNIEKLAEGMERLIKSRELLLKKVAGVQGRAVLYTKDRINMLWEKLFMNILIK